MQNQLMSQQTGMQLTPELLYYLTNQHLQQQLIRTLSQQPTQPQLPCFAPYMVPLQRQEPFYYQRNVSQWANPTEASPRLLPNLDQGINFPNQTPINPQQMALLQQLQIIAAAQRCQALREEPVQQHLQPPSPEINVKQEIIIPKILEEPMSVRDLITPTCTETELQLSNGKCLRKDIEIILRMLVKYHNQDEPRLNHIKKQIVRQQPKLVEIYDQLLAKFNESKKSREETVKFIMRKAFKYFFQCLQKQSDKGTNILNILLALSQKAAHRLCLNHYFKESNIKDLNVLPFRKNSKIKTMNIPFLEMVFQSEQFVQDYKVFLEEFPSIIEKDNDKKIRNISALLVQYQENSFLNVTITIQSQFKKIRTLRRMPWSQSNLKNAERVSEQLLMFQTLKDSDHIHNLSSMQVYQQQPCETVEQSKIEN